MSETTLYDAVCTLLFLSPFILTTLLYLTIHRQTKGVKQFMMTLGGGMILVFSVYLLNTYAIDYAPNEALRMQALESDGVSMLFSLIIAPFFGYIALFVLDGLKYILLAIEKKKYV